MESITRELLICDSEEAYSKKLAEALLLKKEMTISVRICSSLDMVERLLEIGKIKVLLISEEVPYEKRREVFEGKRIVLTRGHCVDLGMEEIELRKYQSIDVISTEILKAFQETTDKPLPFINKKKGKIITVYSPVHRIGKTTFALKLGKKMAENENVLYLNLETYAGIGGYFRDTGLYDLSHLLYYAKQDQDDISVRIASMVRRMGNLDYIPPMQVWTDLRTVSSSEWSTFFERIANQSIYDVIILDLGNNVENVFDILSMSDLVILLQTNDVYAEAKMSQYQYMKTVLHYQELDRKTAVVEMNGPIREAVKSALNEIERWRGWERKYASSERTS